MRPSTRSTAPRQQSRRPVGGQLSGSLPCLRRPPATPHGSGRGHAGTGRGGKAPRVESGTVRLPGSVLARRNRGPACDRGWVPDDLAAKAVEFLRHASDHGFRNGARLRRDPAFRVLRDLPEFQTLVKKLE